MLILRKPTLEAASMRLKNVYGLHRLAVLGVALLVLSVAVFALTAALAHLRSREGIGDVAPLGFGASGGVVPVNAPWRVSEGMWSAVQTGYAAGAGGGSLVADSPGRDLRLSFKVIAGTPLKIPEIFIRERDASHGYCLSATTDGRLSLARFAEGTSHVVASSAILDTSGEANLSFMLEADGARLRAWQDGMLAIDYTDPEPVTGGHVRIRTLDGTLRLSDLSLTPLAH